MTSFERACVGWLKNTLPVHRSSSAGASRVGSEQWIRQTSDELETLLPTGFDNDGGICAASDPPRGTVKLLDDGKLALESVTFNAWQAIMLPRQWDDPEKSDPNPEEAFVDFAGRISKAFTAFENHLTRPVGGKPK